MGDGIYKITQRSQRQSSIELDFSGGMKYADSTLDNNVHKLLVNFDISADTTAITPRQALRTNYKSRLWILNYYKDATVLHVQQTPDQHPIVYFAATADETRNDNVANVPQLFVCREHNLKILDGSCFKPPKNYTTHVKMHDMPSSGKGIPEYIGTKAFNGNYYYLNYLGDLHYLEGANYTDITSEINSIDLGNIVVPKNVTPTEAATYGYNMLLTSPYNFNDAGIVGSTPILLGLVPCKYVDGDCGAIDVAPKQNTQMCFRVFYQAPVSSKYKIVWETRNAENDAYKVTAETYIEVPQGATPGKAYFTTTVPSNAYFVRASFYKETTTPNEYETVTAGSLTAGFNFDKDSDTSISNLKLENYNLKTCKKMAFWNNMLLMYGCEDDATILFFSYTNDPSYFPYPNNIDSFDEPIQHVTQYLDKLMVFTTSKLWQITMNETGVGWTKKLIQSNLRISDYDIKFVQVVKNMLFFKSGNYFYMIVPKATSTTGELTLAPISRPITQFFDNFYNNVRDVLSNVYPNVSPRDMAELIDAYNYLDYEDVHNVYVISVSNKFGNNLMHVDMIYNTVSRYWRIHTYQYPGKLVPAMVDATKSGNLISVYADEGVSCSYVDRDNQLVNDTFDTGTSAEEIVNPQYLDTGYHDYMLNRNKRFRELQIRINNISCTQLDCNLGFIIDGRIRQPLFTYKPSYYLGSDNKTYVILNKTPITRAHLESKTVLNTDGYEGTNNRWKLDFSKFPFSHLCKVRVPISGKGYAPRFQLLIRDSNRYEILGYAWIYRMMNAR